MLSAVKDVPPSDGFAPPGSHVKVRAAAGTAEQLSESRNTTNLSTLRGVIVCPPKSPEVLFVDPRALAPAMIARVVPGKLASIPADAMEATCRFPVDRAYSESVLGSALFLGGRAHGAHESSTIRWIRARSCQLSTPAVRPAGPARTDPSGSSLAPC